jgi:hypothetical protein
MASNLLQATEDGCERMFLPPLVVLGGTFRRRPSFFRPVRMFLLSSSWTFANIVLQPSAGCERMFLSSFVVLGATWSPLF